MWFPGACDNEVTDDERVRGRGMRLGTALQRWSRLGDNREFTRRKADVTTHHCLCDLSWIGVARPEASNRFAGAHHGYVLGQIHHLVQTMSDDDHGAAAVGSSRTRIFAPRYSVLSISTRCASPTERSEMSRVPSMTNPVSSPRRFTSAMARRLSNWPPRVGSLPSTRFSATVSVGTSMKC